MNLRRTPHAALVLATLLTTPSIAQVNPSGTWRTLHTQHFRIHFRPEYRAVAVEAAAEAERAYRQLATQMVAPRGIVDVTLGNDTDTPNGFASTFPSNRVTILLVPPVSDPGLRDYDSWLRLVMVHELAHVFHLDRTRGLWRFLRSVFGRAPGTFPNQYQPSWVTEGLATYYESRFTAGGRADGAFHREVVAVDAAAGTARSPWDALLFTRWPGGAAPYAYGSRFFEHLSRTVERGEWITPLFVHHSSGQLIPFRVGRPLRRAGIPRPLGDEWKRAVVAAVEPQPERVTRSRLIAGALRSEPAPRVAPDGRTVAFLHDDGRGRRRLRVVQLPAAQVLRSHPVNGQVQYDWLGDTLIVAQLDFADRWTMRSDLWRWTPAGSWRRMTTGARLTQPRAGGGMLAAVQIGAGGNVPFIKERAGKEEPGTTWGAVVPSPDGRWIAASRHRNGRWSLVRWPSAVPDSVTVLADLPATADPAWTKSASGAWGVLFVSEVSGFPQIHLWTEANGVSQVTAEPFGARSPASVGDGTLLFTTLGRDGWELRSVEPTPRPALAATPLHASFDSAQRVPVRETGYAAWPSLRPHFWLPVGFNAGEAGLFYGAATGGTDAVGRTSYVAQALVSPSPARVQGSLALVTHALGNPVLDFSASNDWALINVDSVASVVSVQQLEAAVGAAVLSRRWRRFVALRIAAEYEGRRFTADPDTTVTDICATCRNRDRVGGTATLAVGSTVSAPLSVSLQDGATASLLYRRREEQGTSRWLDEVRGRAALYARLGPRIGFAHPVLAVRLSAGAFNGPITDRLSVGGVSSGGTELAFGLTLGTQRSFPVRGYRAGTLRGRRAATVTAEYRLPLAIVGKSLGHLPLGADKFALAVFGDVGDAWDPGQAARLHRLRSVGVELIGDLTVSYDLPLHVRLGVAQPRTGRPQAYGGFSADF